MKKINVHVEFIEGVLGTANADKDIHSEFIASKAPDAKSLKEEIEAIGVEEVERKATTVFPRDEDDDPIFWDYQWKGFFKDSCAALRKVKGSECSKIKAFKKEIDGLIFPQPRKIKISIPEGKEISLCQRPLRAQTLQGERVALASSEEIPEGTTCDFSITILKDDLLPMIEECLKYGELRGMGQWRNSGKGRFVVTIKSKGDAQ